jgi:hypothetical protein
MPFKSEAQRRYLWANEPEIARDWTDTYGSRIQKNDGGIMRLPFRRGGNPHKNNSAGPAGGASAGGNYGGDSSGGVSAKDMSNTRNEGPAGTRPGPQNTVDPGFQNALKNQQIRQNTITQQQNPNYGQFFGSSVPTYQPLSFVQSIGQGIGNLASGVGDYITSGGMWGELLRGLGSLSKPGTGNVGPAGIKTDGTYGTVADAIRASRRNEPIIRNDDGGPPLWQQLGYPSYEAWAASQNQGIEGIEVDDDAITLDDIVLRFQGADRTLDPQAVGLENTDQLREMIQERVKKLYT